MVFWGTTDAPFAGVDLRISFAYGDEDWVCISSEVPVGMLSRRREFVRIEFH